MKSFPIIKLLQADPGPGICIQLGVTAQSLGDTPVRIIEDRWKRSEEMHGQDRTLGVGQIEGELFDFGDG